MADRGRKGKSGKKQRGEVFEETMQVRVRRKNPMIERVSTTPPYDNRTNAEISFAPPVGDESMYEEDESSETTQEFDLRDREALLERMENPGAAKKRVRSSHKKPRGSGAAAGSAARGDASAARGDASAARGDASAASAARSDASAARGDASAASAARSDASGASAAGTKVSAASAARSDASGASAARADVSGASAARGAASASRAQGRAAPAIPAAGPRMYADDDATEIADQSPLAVSGPIVDPAPRVIAAPLPEGAVPRGLLGKWGTKAVGAAARKANIEKKAQALNPVLHVLLKPVRSEMSPDHLASLERVLSGELDERVDATMSPKRSLEHLINEPGFQELTLPERALVLQAVALEPRDIATTKSGIALMKSGVFRRMRPAEREKLFTVFVAFDSECRALLARLSARPLRTRSALEDRDFEDAPLVSHLSTIARDLQVAPAIVRAGFRPEQVAPLVLSSIANPERLAFEEGADGVLSIIEFGLADCSPAELVRLWIELLRGEMTARLAGEGELDLGAKLRANPDLRFSIRETPIRVGLELLSVLANPRRGGDRSAFLMPAGHGVDADVISRSLAALYGTGFTVAAGAATALRHLERTNADQQRVPPVFVTMLYERGERMFVFDRVADGDLLVRAPHGRSSKRKGAQRVDPLRVVEEPDVGLDRFAKDQVQELGVALVPR